MMNTKLLMSLLCVWMCICLEVKAQSFDPSVNIALSCDAFASSGVAKEAVDGKGSNMTRWESAQNDDQWWYVDLGKIYDLNKIEILWEGAYGETFQLLGATTLSVEGNESDWVFIKEINRTLASPNNYLESIDVSEAFARYVKFKGVKRGTGYGYSFWEFRVFAFSEHVEVEDPELSSILVSPNPIEVIAEREVPFSIATLNQVGGVFKDAEITNVIIEGGSGAEIIHKEGTYFVKGLTKGSYTLTVSAKDKNTNKSVSGTAVVNVSERAVVATLSLSAASNIAVAARPVSLAFTCLDQYGGNINPGELTWKINGNGQVANNQFTSSAKGITGISVKSANGVESNGIEIETVGIGGNLALNKEFEFSAENSTEPAKNAVDGNDGTRWVAPEPAEAIDHKYEAWYVVDLGAEYSIDLIEIFWEGATAADYTISYSLDNIDFGEPVFSKTDVPGMVAVTHQLYGQMGKARYVKLHSTKASTGYGISVWEFRVFGTESYETVLKNIGTETDPVLTGVWNLEQFNTLVLDYKNLTTIDFSRVSDDLAEVPDMMELNPNCMIYVKNHVTGMGNLVQFSAGDGAAEKIELTDGLPFNNTKAFMAKEISYTRDYGTMPYATICLPFSAMGTPVENLEKVNQNSISFKDAPTMEPGTAYLMVSPGEKGITTINKTNVLVPIANLKVVEKDGYKFIGTYRGIPEKEAVGFLMLRQNGNEFAVGSETSYVPPFHAYIETPSGNKIKQFSIIHDGGAVAIEKSTESNFVMWSTNGALEVIASNDQDIQIYSIDGCRVRIVLLNEGYNKIEGLPKGLYIINNQKIIIR